LFLVGLPHSDATATFLQIEHLALYLPSRFREFTQMPVCSRYRALGRSECVRCLGVGRFGVCELFPELLQPLLQLFLL
jgi:hypothetical protein